MSDKDDGIKQNLLFDDSELESCNQVWTPEESKILNDTRENQLNYIRTYLLECNLITGKVTFQDVSTKLVYELVRRNDLTLLQLNYLIATQEEKKEFAIDNHARGETVDFICSVIFCKKSIVYKWLKENKITVLEKRKDYLENKINEYNVLNCYPSIDTYSDYLDVQIKRSNLDPSNFEDLQNNEVFMSKIAGDLETLKGYVLEKHKGDSLYLEEQEKQFLKYKKELEQTKQELERLKQVSIQENAPACTTATKLANDILFNDFFDFITYCKNIELFAQRQTSVSHSLRLTPKITETKIQLKLIKTNTKSLILQMDKPKNVNMAYIRDLFVLANQQIAKLDKENLTPENLRLNPQSIKISTIDYYENSNYESLRKIQEMSKDEYISFLGSLAIFGKSKIYDGKGKSRKEIFASESEDIKKKYIPMFKSVGYQNNNIELVLNDEFPWESFTLHYFTMLPDNYLKLSENAKTLLMYIVSQARIRKTPKFKITYSDLQILFNLKTYEEDKKHATERIIEPIQKACKEVSEKSAYFICIDEDIDKSRTPKEILDTGSITVTVLNDIKENIDIVNDSKTHKIENAIKRNKKTSQK